MSRRRRFVLASATLAWGLGSGAVRVRGGEVGGGPGAAAAAVARVVGKEGSALVLRPGDDRPLEAGAVLFRGDQIRTGPGAKLRLELEGGLSVVVGPRSEVSIDDYLAPGAGEAGGAGLELLLGLVAGIVRLIAPAQAAPRRVEVRTPTALASVRSTEWLVDVTPAGLTGVFVLRGLVEVAARAGGGGSVTVGPGLGTNVAPGAAPTAPAAWGAARRDDALARTAF